MALPTVLLFLLYSLLQTTTAANPLQLNLPSTIALNATKLQTRTHCFKRTMARRLLPTSFNDCHNALRQLVDSKPEYQYHLRQNFSPNVSVAENVWHLPITVRNRTCEISLSTHKYNDVAEVTLAEIHDDLLEEGKGVLRQCLFSPWPLGGTTWLGRPNELLINVLGIQAYGDGVASS